MCIFKVFLNLRSFKAWFICQRDHHFWNYIIDSRPNEYKKGSRCRSFSSSWEIFSSVWELSPNIMLKIIGLTNLFKYFRIIFVDLVIIRLFTSKPLVKQVSTFLFVNRKFIIFGQLILYFSYLILSFSSYQYLFDCWSHITSYPFTAFRYFEHA